MARFSPVSRTGLIRKPRGLGFEGPFQRGKHPYMVRGSDRLTIPNVHREAISVDLLTRLLKQANVTREDWERA